MKKPSKLSTNITIQKPLKIIFVLSLIISSVVLYQDFSYTKNFEITTRNEINNFIIGIKNNLKIQGEHLVDSEQYQSCRALPKYIKTFKKIFSENYHENVLGASSLIWLSLDPYCHATVLGYSENPDYSNLHSHSKNESYISVDPISNSEVLNIYSQIFKEDKLVGVLHIQILKKDVVDYFRDKAFLRTNIGTTDFYFDKNHGLIIYTKKNYLYIFASYIFYTICALSFCMTLFLLVNFLSKEKIKEQKRQFLNEMFDKNQTMELMKNQNQRWHIEKKFYHSTNYIYSLLLSEKNIPQIFAMTQTNSTAPQSVVTLHDIVNVAEKSNLVPALENGVTIENLCTIKDLNFLGNSLHCLLVISGLIYTCILNAADQATIKIFCKHDSDYLKVSIKEINGYPRNNLEIPTKKIKNECALLRFSVNHLLEIVELEQYKLYSSSDSTGYNMILEIPLPQNNIYTATFR